MKQFGSSLSTSAESRTYPVTTGAIFHKLSPKLQHSRDPLSHTDQPPRQHKRTGDEGTMETERKGAGGEEGRRKEEEEERGDKGE